MKRLLMLVVGSALLLGQPVSAAGLLREDLIQFDGCRGVSGYVGQSADFKINFICTPDGVMHRLTAP